MQLSIEAIPEHLLHEVPLGVLRVAKECSAVADSIAIRYCIPSTEQPIAGLNMAFAALVQCFEVFDCYYNQWSKLDPTGMTPAGQATMLNENEQRLSSMQNSTFVHLVSAFEASAKISLKLPKSPVAIGGRPYLGTVMRKSHELGIISDADMTFWRFALELRNCTVHNNGVADVSMSHTFGESRTMSMVTGQMTWSSARLATLLFDATVAAYARWATAFIDRTRA